MPGKRLVTDSQWDIMLTYLIKYKNVIDYATGDQLWMPLANRLNAIPEGISKSPAGWKAYWNNSKYAVRKRFREGAKLTLREKRVIEIVGTLHQGEETDDTPKIQLKTEPESETSITMEEEEERPAPQASKRSYDEVNKPSPKSSKLTYSKVKKPSPDSSYNSDLMGPPPSPPQDIRNDDYPEAAPWVLSFQRERLKLKEKKLEFELQVALQKQRETEHRTLVLERMATALERIANDVSAIRTQVDRTQL